MYVALNRFFSIITGTNTSHVRAQCLTANRTFAMAKTSITPLGDRVLVDPVVADEKTASGIIIPDTASREKPKQGKVVAVGELEEVKNVKVGDTVLFSDYGYDEVKADDHEYYIIQSKNLLAVIK